MHTYHLDLPLKSPHLYSFPYTEITKTYKIRRKKQRNTTHTDPLIISELTYGDIVVHINHGIGKYLGIEKHNNHLGISTEFISIEYAKNGKLYVPLTQAHLVTKYLGSHENESPKLHTIGGTRWQKNTTASRTLCHTLC